MKNQKNKNQNILHSTAQVKISFLFVGIFFANPDGGQHVLLDRLQQRYSHMLSNKVI